jgi:medium-chain acyl-[acyl-carrier-protein] hydrolase
VQTSSPIGTPAKTVQTPPWFQVQPDSRARFRLFCFPYAGSGSAVFRPWTRQLPSSIEVVPALLPGRELRMREPAFSRVEPLIDVASREIVPYLDRPFAFFGHSMGAIVSYELALRLRAERGIEPEHLFVSGRRAPQLPEPGPRMHELPEPEFRAELERLNGTPKELLEHAELMQLLIPLLRADFSVCHTYTYVPSSPLKCPITAFGGVRDVTTTRADIEPWCEHTSGAFRLQMLDGDHFFINQQQATILSIIMQALR